MNHSTEEPHDGHDDGQAHRPGNTDSPGNGHLMIGGMPTDYPGDKENSKDNENDDKYFLNA